MIPSQGSRPFHARLFGLDILPYSLEQAADTLAQAARLRDGRARVVATPNTDHVVHLARDAGLKSLYSKADYLFADGMPLVWASRWLGAPLPERVTGSDLTVMLCARAAAEQWRVVVLGGKPGEELDLAARLRRRFPGLDAKIFTPSMGFDPYGKEAESLARRIAGHAPDLVFACLGFARQEQWALRFSGSLPGGLILCVGSAIHFASGQSRRAPRFLQRAGLEWLWRLLHSPRQLWRRYLNDAYRFPLLCWNEWRARR